MEIEPELAELLKTFICSSLSLSLAGKQKSDDSATTYITLIKGTLKVKAETSAANVVVAIKGLTRGHKYPPPTIHGLDCTCLHFKVGWGGATLTHAE